MALLHHDEQLFVTGPTGFDLRKLVVCDVARCGYGKRTRTLCS